MPQFLLDHGLELFFGILAAVFAVISLRYTIKEHRERAGGFVDGGSVHVYLDRASVLKAILEMVDEAHHGDVLWGQCIGCRGYTGGFRNAIMQAAARGAVFHAIVNGRAISKDDARELSLVRAATVKEAKDNSIRLLGLSDRRVIVTLPTSTSYSSLLISDPAVVKIFRRYFDERWNSLS